MKFYLIFVFSAAISACASVRNSDYYYNEILIRNNSVNTVTDVEILVRNIGAKFSCSNIPPRGVCSNKFPKRKLLGNPVTIKWLFYGSSRSTDQFFVKPPRSASKMIPLRGVLEFVDNGSIRAYLEHNAGDLY
jgi:hypothetical protein